MVESNGQLTDKENHNKRRQAAIGMMAKLGPALLNVMLPGETMEICFQVEPLVATPYKAATEAIIHVHRPASVFGGDIKIRKQANG